MYFAIQGLVEFGGFRAADRVQQHDTVVGEQRGALLEVGVIEVDTDVLEHADRDDTIERTGNVAIVLEQEPCRSCEVFLGSPRIGRLQLLA